MSQLHTSPEFDALTHRIDEIAPILRGEAEKCEELRRPTDEVVRALGLTGVLKIGIPAELGGYEFSPSQMIRAVERLSYHEASVGWAAMIVQFVTGATAAYLGQEAAADLFADVPAGRHALLAGQGTRPGEAVRVDGGYRISGRWSFASGIPLASHIHTAAFCAETGQALICTLPKEQARLIDNWDVMGLRATHSIDYVCEDVFVPQTHAFGAATMENKHGGAVYRLGLVNLAAVCHTGWALGVGRRLLDELKALAGTKTGTPNASVDTDQFHAAFAQAEARFRAARAWAMELWADNETTLDRGENLSTEQETLARLVPTTPPGPHRPSARPCTSGPAPPPCAGATYSGSSAISTPAPSTSPPARWCCNTAAGGWPAWPRTPTGSSWTSCSAVTVIPRPLV